MEQFNISNQLNDRFSTLEKIVQQGRQYGLDLSDILNKIKSVKSMIKDGIIRIVLLGSFSDGKTSAIAGLLGRLEDTMKIDEDESSDELKVYRPEGLKKGFEIVDTPGLFGTKEKELDGRNVKYLDITKKYLSEAHIVIYVCDAVTPLKDSHASIIKWIMRDLNKLNSSIFVINKMDEAGYDLLDDSDYNRGKDIKRNALVERLRSTINLTPDEERKLHIVCIAADPKGKGLNHWFAKSNDYMRRSHIGMLRDSLNDVVNNCNAEILKSNSVLASIKDMTDAVSNSIEDACNPIRQSLKKLDDSCFDLNEDLGQLKLDLANNQSEMQHQLERYKKELYTDIENASIDTIGSVAKRILGIQNEKITFDLVHRRIEQITNTCYNSNNASVESSQVKFKREFEVQENFCTDALKAGTEYLKHVNAGQIKAVRNVLLPCCKFKPWGAIKFAKNLNIFAVILSLGIELYSYFNKKKKQNAFLKDKESLINALDDIFAHVYESFQGENFFHNYAPSYSEMQQQLNNRQNEIEKLRQKVTELEKFKSQINSWKNDGKYVEYTEV